MYNCNVFQSDNYFIIAPVNEIVVLPKGRRKYIFYFYLY